MTMNSPAVATAPVAQRETTPNTPAIFGGPPLFAEPLPMVHPELPPAEGLLQQFGQMLESGRLTNGETVDRLERAAARYLDVPECVAVSSCTLGLMLVEKCLGLSGQVIVPSFTFFATAHSLLWNGLEPVLVDCDGESWNLAPERVLRAIGPRTSAILAVHISGNPAAAGELEEIAHHAQLRLIYDAAHAFGSSRQGAPVGGCGGAEVFSLSPTKLLVAGEGGLVATQDRELARTLRAARNYGNEGDYDCRLAGLNARMTEFQAALGLAALPLVDRHVERRNRLAALYEQYLGEEPGLSVQQIRPQDRSARKDFSIVIDEARFGVSRDFLRQALEKENVPVRSYFDPPLHRQRLYLRYYFPEHDKLENSERISRGVLSLPLYSRLKEADVIRIARRILEIRDWAAGRW